MRNLKKILALALVFAMALTFTAGAASDFSDKADIGTNYVDDVNMLVELGVVAGYPDGTYKPKANITRAEFAKMAYTLKYGSDTDGNLFANQKSIFTDVEGNANVAWAKGYINYCANQGIVSGIGNNKYGPQDNITVAQATKMILVIMGCDAAKEGFIGTNWQANVVAKAIDLGVFDGWTGDPTSLATRELVAKLMKNAIFAPVYEYSAITGAGSQKNALGTEDNQTLGEKTMGLKDVTGIVVANERYFITTDEDGDDISSLVRGTSKEDESLIYYEEKRSNGSIEQNLLTVDRALSDELLGAKVNVFFKADEANDGSYKNVEVIGNVLVNSDTVSYTVSAYNVKFMPDGDSDSSTEIVPYLELTVDGQTKQIKADSTVGKVAKKDDAKGVAEVYNYFNGFTYASNETKNGAAALSLDLNKAGALNAVGNATLDTYRFVSVDGGKTYSYIFKMVSDTTNASYGTVTNYNEAKKTLRINGLTGTFDLDEDVVINGKIATDDNVVYWRENGKLYVQALEVVKGAVESFTNDGDIVLGGKTYYAWGDCDLDGETDLHDYFKSNPNAYNEGTKYYVFGNMIMEIDADEEVTSTANYAVILNSSYSEDMQTAYVTLAFADNTEGTYKVYNKLKSVKTDNTKSGIRTIMEKNAAFANVVKYTIRDDGSVDLSANDVDNTSAPTAFEDGAAAQETGKVTDGKFSVGSAQGKFGLNSSSVIFMLYNNSRGDVTSKAYKLDDVDGATGADIAYNQNNAAQNGPVASVVYNTKSGNTKYIVAAAMSCKVGATGKPVVKSDSDTEIAYVVSGYQRYNISSDEYYYEFKLINKDGLKDVKTVEDVKFTDGTDAIVNEYTGKLDVNGTYLRYEMNAEGVITALDNEYTDINTAFVSGAQGLYLVSISNVRGDVVSFYDATCAFDSDDARADTALATAKFSKDGYDVIGIDDGEYTGKDITKLAKSFTLTANQGNAVIELDKDGDIVTVFSFASDVEAH